MKRMGFLILMGLILSFSLGFGQEVYRWVDEKGTVHFTDDLGQVPEKYQEKAQKEISPKEPPPTQPAPPPTPSPKGGAAKESGPMPAPQQKDILGRGEEWWRAKAIEWNEKLKTARENYEKAFNERKAKEQELEISKFKPDSFKRKLKAEIKALEEKGKDWEKQMKEARNMLENVLPKQAQDDRANPDWLKIEDKK
jgi:Domain of unknown function (DUF4124)